MLSDYFMTSLGYSNVSLFYFSAYAASCDDTQPSQVHEQIWKVDNIFCFLLLADMLRGISDSR